MCDMVIYYKSSYPFLKLKVYNQFFMKIYHGSFSLRIRTVEKVYRRIMGESCNVLMKRY